MTGDVGGGLVLKTVEQDGCVVLRVSGTIDYLNAGEVRDAVRRAGTDCVVLDLAEVAFVDSTGLAMLLAADQQVRGRGGRLRLAGPGEQLTRLLHTTNLDLRLAVHPDVATALNSRSE
jgi:anti-anti-sigma factor